MTIFNEKLFGTIEKSGEKIERTVITSINYFGGILENTLIITIILLVVRELFPQLATKIPAAYQFIDTYQLPFLNWFYAVAIKAISWFLSLPLVVDAVEWLKNLAM